MHASKEARDPSLARRSAVRACEPDSRGPTSESKRDGGWSGADERSPWCDALAQLDRTAEILGLDPGLLGMLRRPRHVIEVAVPIRADGGELVTFDGFRVQHSLTRGPGKGGLRYHPHATLPGLRRWRCG